jgi:hypothetical protein
LGVLLYQLLGGSHPTAGDTQTQLDRLKAIVEQAPKRLSEAAAGQPDAAIAARARALRGDLDTIVAKALKTLPAERYANAQALADDLRRWLAHEPIAARPDSRWYVAGRFVRRHRWAVGASSLAVLVLVGLTVVSALQARRAEAAEHQAEQRRQQSDELLAYMLGDFADSLRPIGKLALLDSVGARALGYLTAESPVQPAERLNRAKALTVIGEVRVERREFGTAMQPLQAARELLRGDSPEPGLTAVWRKTQGAAAFWIGQVHNQQRELGLARRAWEDYREVSQAWLRELPDDPHALQELSNAHTNLGSVALGEARSADATREFAASLALKRRALAALPEARRGAALADLANTASWLGTAQLWRGETQAALLTFQDALQALAPRRRAQPDDAVSKRREAALYRWVGEALSGLGHRAEARVALDRARALFSELTASDPANGAWRVEYLVAQLLALEVSPPPRAELRAALAVLAQQLAEAESASTAARVRRLSDRARWARLTWAAVEPPGQLAARQGVEAVREQLRQSLQQGIEPILLSRALAAIDAVLVQGGWERAAACAMVNADLQLLRERAAAVPVPSAERAVAACEASETHATVANARGAPTARH